MLSHEHFNVHNRLPKLSTPSGGVKPGIEGDIDPNGFLLIARVPAGADGIFPAPLGFAIFNGAPRTGRSIFIDCIPIGATEARIW